MEIKNQRYVELEKLFSEEQLDIFGETDLPFSIGDTDLVCITADALLGWIGDEVEVEGDDRIDWSPTIAKIKALPADVLVCIWWGDALNYLADKDAISAYDELAQAEKEYAAAYNVVHYAMSLVNDDNVCSRLQTLKNVLHTASVFVNDELDELPEKAAELGLDRWQEEEEAWGKEQAQNEEAT